MIKFYFPSLFSLTYCILFPLSYNFDKKIAANLYVRLNHSIGCILKLVPILYNHQLVLMDPIQKIVMPLEVKNLFDRSISFFIWDCMALLISDEKDKLFYMGHHLISTLSIGFTRYFEYDWYLICVALFIGEITNPLTQVSEFYILVEKENITFEKFYFYSMFLVRGIITPIVIINYTYNIYKQYELIQNMYICSILINYSIMNILFIGSVSWIHKKYLLLYKNNNDKKVS